MIEIRWQQSDQTTGTASAASRTSIGSTTSSSGLAPTSSHAPSPNLSSGAKAGIGIGVSLGVVIVVAVVAFFLRHKRRPSTATGQQEQQIYPKQELQGNPLAELPSNSNPSELPSNPEPRHELS
jgi:hypothetical protein